MQRHLTALPLFSSPKIVAVYDAQPFEVPLADFIAAVASRGSTVLYPRVEKGSRVLGFHEIRAEADWASGPLGLRQPRASAHSVAIEQIDAFIVPGVAFTTDGRRLGRGGGYYDATLALRSPHSTAIGVVFDLNLVDEVPEEPHDRRVDFVATERGVSAAR